MPKSIWKLQVFLVNKQKILKDYSWEMEVFLDANFFFFFFRIKCFRFFELSKLGVHLFLKKISWLLTLVI